jgi:hypothetical protein
MKKLVFLFLLLGMAMLACEGSVISMATPMPAPNPLDIGATMMAAQMAAKATEQSIGLQFTGTAQVFSLTATIQAIGTQEAVKQQARADARATQQRLDAEATQEQAKRDQQSTATYEAFMAHQTMTQQSFQVTSTAQMIGTQTAYPQTEQASEATQAMAVVYGKAQEIEVNAKAKSVEYALERERVTNMIRAWVPWMGFVIVLGVLAVVALQNSRTRVVQKDAFGALPGLVLEGVAIDMDSLTSARLLTDGSVEFKQHDDKITERKQQVEMVRAMPAGRPEVVDKIFELNSGRKTPVVEVIESETMSRAMLDDIQDQVVEEE